MQRSGIEAASSQEAREIVRAAEDYVREVARKSDQSAQQVEPVIQATLTTLLELWSSEDQTRRYEQFWRTLTQDTRLWETYWRAGEQRPQFLQDIFRHFLSQSDLPAFSNSDQDEGTGVRSARRRQRPIAAEEPISVDLVAAIAGTNLVFVQAKAWPHQAPEPDSLSAEQLVALERQNMLRVFDGWQELLARSISGPELAKRLGVSRQRLNALRREDRLLGLKVPIRRELHYPVWQFGDDGQPLATMPRLLEAAREAGLDPRDLDALVVSAGAGEGKPPIEHLRAGDEAFVLGIIRAAGE